MLFRTLKVPTTAIICLFFSVCLSAQESQEDVNVINWYYSTMFGTGYYTVGDAKVAILNVPISYSFKTIREKKDKYGIRLLVPVSLGFHFFDFKEILDLPNSVATLSIVPGVEFEYAVTETWHLIPYARLGAGQEFKQNIWAWIYGTGIKSRWILPIHKGEFTLGNALNYAGYVASDDSSKAMISLVAGLNWVTPMKFTLFNRNTNVGTHLIYYGYLNELDFVAEGEQSLKIRNEFEFAVTLGTHKSRTFLGFDYTRFGFAFRFGKELRAVRLVAGFPF